MSITKRMAKVMSVLSETVFNCVYNCMIQLGYMFNCVYNCMIQLGYMFKTLDSNILQTLEYNPPPPGIGPRLCISPLYSLQKLINNSGAKHKEKS